MQGHFLQVLTIVKEMSGKNIHNKYTPKQLTWNLKMESFIGNNHFSGSMLKCMGVACLLDANVQKKTGSIQGGLFNISSPNWQYIPILRGVYTTHHLVPI